MKGSSFAGFLDGYKSRNIASIETPLQYRLNEITDLIDVLITDIRKSKNNPELLFVLQRNQNLLKDRNRHDLMEVLFSFGESLKGDLLIINTKVSDDKGFIKEKIRKIIYNFLELAKLSEDTKLINLAITIGENFSY